MALYYDGDTGVTADFDDPVLLTLRQLDEVVAATGTAGVEDEVPSSACLSGIFDACGVCDGDGLSCSTTTTATETPNHHAAILVSLLIFAAFMMIAFISCAGCRCGRRDRPRTWRQGYEPV